LHQYHQEQGEESLNQWRRAGADNPTADSAAWRAGAAFRGPKPTWVLWAGPVSWATRVCGLVLFFWPVPALLLPLLLELDDADLNEVATTNESCHGLDMLGGGSAHSL